MTTATVSEQQAQAAMTQEELLKRQQRRDQFNKWFFRIAGYVVFLGLWELASPLVLEEALLPGPRRVLDTFYFLAFEGPGTAVDWERVREVIVPWGILAGFIGTALLFFFCRPGAGRVARITAGIATLIAFGLLFVSDTEPMRWLLLFFALFAYIAPTKDGRKGWALVWYLVLWLIAAAAITVVSIYGSGKIVTAFQATLTRIAIGFSLSFMIGAAIGILTQNRWWEGFFKDAVVIGLTSPGLIWALIGAIIFGSRWYGPVITIILTTFALVTVNVSEGIRSLPKDLMDMGRAFHVPLGARQRHIVIPHLAPFLFTGLRFGFSIAWKVTVLTEVFSSSEGIGFEMRTSAQLFQVDEFLTWILAFFVFALFLEKVVLQAFEKRFFRWRQEAVT